MDYSQLSDFEINKLVAIALGLEVKDWPEADRPYIWHVVKNELGNDYFDYTDYKDYCNNASDAWPITSGHKLSIINADDEWLCVPEDTAVDGITGDDVQMIYSGDGHIHANPLRAAMIVFLMMQDNNHA